MEYFETVVNTTLNTAVNTLNVTRSAINTIVANTVTTVSSVVRDAKNGNLFLFSTSLILLTSLVTHLLTSDVGQDRIILRALNHDLGKVCSEIKKLKEQTESKLEESDYKLELYEENVQQNIKTLKSHIEKIEDCIIEEEY